MGAKTYQELVFWQLSNELRKKIIAFTSREPAKSHRRFSDHIREAVSAAYSNAAEGFGRRSHAEFAQFIGIARASVMETQDKLLEALQSQYIEQAEFDDMSTSPTAPSALEEGCWHISSRVAATHASGEDSNATIPAPRTRHRRTTHHAQGTKHRRTTHQAPSRTRHQALGTRHPRRATQSGAH